jgi:hypothetical protein
LPKPSVGALPPNSKLGTKIDAYPLSVANTTCLLSEPHTSEGSLPQDVRARLIDQAWRKDVPSRGWERQSAVFQEREYGKDAAVVGGGVW